MNLIPSHDAFYIQKMIEAQKAAEQTKLKQSNSSELFVNIFKSSKPQIINIFFAFVCALLAYQIRGLRQGYKRLLDDIEVKEREIDMLRKKLREVCEVVESENVDQGEESQVIDKQTLLWTVSEKCTRAISDIFSQSDRSPGYSWILARKLASGDVTETTRLTDAIKQIIKGEMQNAVGDVLWSKDELKQRRVMDLEAELNEVRDNAFAGDAQMSGLVEMLEQAHGEERMSGMKRAEGEDGKVKRTRYAI